ncbi:MAG: hypothetical protein ACO32I_07095 [Candidatus Limnocylindrus sp.]
MENHRMNEMERKFLNEVYRRITIELHRARARGDTEMTRVLTEQLITLEMQLGSDGRGNAALIR